MVFISVWLFSLTICPSCLTVLLEMAGIPSFHGRIILHCIYKPHIIYPFISKEYLSCLHVLGIAVKCCSEHGNGYILANLCFHFLQMNTQNCNFWSIQFYFQSFCDTSILFSIVTALIYYYQQCARVPFSLNLSNNSLISF